MTTALLLHAPIPADVEAQMRQGLIPTLDYMALADALAAQVIAPSKPPWGRFGKLSRAWRLARAAWEGFRRRQEYDCVVSDLDHVGLALAILFKLTRTRKGHVVICHSRMAQRPLVSLLRRLRLHRYIDRFVCYGPAIAERLRREGNVPDDQVVVVRHTADHRFWQPQPVEPERMVATAGLFHRDYATLVEAFRGLDTRLEAAAFSPWMNPRRTGVPLPDLPPNVSFTRLDPQQLRDLYARSLFVAVPLVPSEIQIGSLVVYEAMAMGKATVVTNTIGQSALGIVREGETGLLVPPGDVAAWKRAISYLADHPEEAACMGRRARQVVEEGLNLSRYVEDMVALVREVEYQRRAVRTARSEGVYAGKGD